MKTVNVLIGTALLCLVHATGEAESLNIPDDLKSSVNQLEFISHVARRCDFDLRVYGFEGALKSDCTDFRTQLPAIMDTWSEGLDRWIILERTVKSSTDRERQLEWSSSALHAERSLDLIAKTTAHLKFIIDTKKATVAKETPNAKPTETPQKRRASGSR
jgi:hypothetical protein